MQEVQQYIIECTGGHLRSKRYVHKSGLMCRDIKAAERFTLVEANRLITVNRPSQIQFNMLPVTTETTIGFDDELFKLKKSLNLKS